MVIVILAVAMASLRWADRIGLGVIWQSELAFYAYAVAVLLIASWTVYLAAVAVLRCAFRVTGMMTRDEAKCYPLRADKRRVEPWPETWQKPDVGARQ